jgi:redox-sensitive bicupin YhaK (pirin superfamily)
VTNVRLAAERGHTRLSWLDSYHTFSFDQYFDQKHMSFGPLRVINEDTIAPSGGFGTHSHRDMEIITYVVEGELEHKDSLGTGSIIRPGEIQKMSAGTGISHSEYNPSSEKPVHLLQIWIVPNKQNIQPKYEQKSFESTPGQFKLLGSPDGKGLVSIHQNVSMYALSTEPGKSASQIPPVGARAWLQIVQGICTVNGTELKAGDGLKLMDCSKIEVLAKQRTELLLFEIL